MDPTLTQFLQHRLEQLGQDVVFGIPGDYALAIFDGLQRRGTRIVTLTHEPSVGYAADAFARIRGLGTALVTYGAGALNMVNAVAQAYAERVPVLVISGAPDLDARRRDLLVHHRVKRMSSQERIYDEVTCATAVLDDPLTAALEIDRVIATMLTERRPGYIELPADMVEVPLEPWSIPSRMPAEAPSLRECDGAARLAEQLAEAESPVVLAGVEVMRYGLRTQLARFVERWNIPCLNTMLAMATLPDGHQNCLGTFMGACGEIATIRAVQGADLIVRLGVTDTDVNYGLYSLKPGDSADRVLSYRVEDGPDDLREVLADLARTPARRTFSRSARAPAVEGFPGFGMETAIRTVNDVLGLREVTVTIDVGDVMFAASRLRSADVLAPSYYASMGYAVPAAIGAGFAAPRRRTVALVGDGAFQMTGAEIGTAVRYGLEPIIVVLDNGGYETLRTLDGDRSYFETSAWDYAAFAASIGVGATRASDEAEFRDALHGALRCSGPVLIEAKLEATPSTALQSLRDVAWKRQGKTAEVS